ncbi:hypothetical protein JZU68_02210 [bacterium]|nr:hypothetical protein [bacterium]
MKATVKELKATIQAIESEIIKNSVDVQEVATLFKAWAKFTKPELEEYLVYVESLNVKNELEPSELDKEMANDIGIFEAMLIDSEVVPEVIEEEPKAVSLADTKESNLIRFAISSDLYSGSIWSQTGRIIADEKAKFQADKKKMSNAFTLMLNKNVDPSLIPEDGPDRKGEIIKLRKKDGSVKWSSWEVTARLVQNCSTIFLGIEKLGYEKVFPYDMLISRSELEKMLKELDADKPGEAPEQTVKRCLEMAAKKLPEVQDLAALIEVDPFIKEILEAFKEAMEFLKSGATSSSNGGEA